MKSALLVLSLAGTPAEIIEEMSPELVADQSLAFNIFNTVNGVILKCKVINSVRLISRRAEGVKMLSSSAIIIIKIMINPESAL